VFPLGLALACGHPDSGHLLAVAMPRANNGFVLGILADHPVLLVAQALAETTKIATRQNTNHQWEESAVISKIVRTRLLLKN
jgi:hypothetical protein